MPATIPLVARQICAELGKPPKVFTLALRRTEKMLRGVISRRRPTAASPGAPTRWGWLPLAAPGYTAGMIQTGERLPEATLFESVEFGEACPVSPSRVNAAQAAQGKRVVIFGLPGAFTPTCSAKHLPGYLQHLPALKAKGVDEVWCVSVNDGYVMAVWGRDQGVIGKIRMLGDGNGELARKLGLERETADMGLRMRRCSLLVDDGIVRQVNVEEKGVFGVSSAESMLAQLGG